MPRHLISLASLIVALAGVLVLSVVAPEAVLPAALAVLAAGWLGTVAPRLRRLLMRLPWLRRKRHEHGTGPGRLLAGGPLDCSELRKEVAQQLKLAELHGGPLALLLLEVVQFNGIEATHGRRLGDRLLQAAASRVRESLRSYDTFCRLDGPGFLILLPPPADGIIACQVADRLVETLRTPLMVDGHSFELSLSVAIATLEPASARRRGEAGEGPPRPRDEPIELGGMRLRGARDAAPASSDVAQAEKVTEAAG
jgi:diguanylate cyclase (GGDEF)-like protein